jgi:hypothetical protein
MAWRWVPKDNTLFEALHKNSSGFSDTEKGMVMLRLSLGFIREYAGEKVTAGREPDHPAEYAETQRADSDTAIDSDSLSGASNDGDRDDVSEGPESDGASVVTRSGVGALGALLRSDGCGRMYRRTKTGRGLLVN